MPNWVPIIDPDGLNNLFNRLARLRQQLEEIAKEREKILAQQRSHRGKDEEDPENDVNEDFATRFAACHQLIAVLEFVEDSKNLMPDLHKLLMALLDLDSGRSVKWLRPAPKKGQPPPPAEEGSLHGRYAAIMDWLIKEGGKSKEEAARFVVEHGGLRRRLESGERARKAFHPWETVANWRDRVTRPYDPSRAAEYAGFHVMYEIIRGREFKGADASVEIGAKHLLRALKNLF